MISLMTALGLAAVLAGGTLVAANVVGVSAAATSPTLSLTSTAAGVTCNNSVPTAPVCSGLASGDVVTVSGAHFTDNSLASIEQCNSDPTQSQILFLGNDIPVSCSPLALTNISSKGVLSGARTVTTGTVGPPAVGTPTCTQTTPSTSVITGCTTSGSGATDAANFPCPPTPTQQAAGDTCVLAIGDQAGDRAVGTILFGSETIGGSTTTTGSTTSTTGGTTTTTGSTTTTTSPTVTSTATQVSTAAVTLGPSGTVDDSVTVQGTPTNGSPTGNVNFYVCQTGTGATLIPGPCAATAGSHLATAHLSSAAGDASTASSGVFTPTSAGTWCFSAVYGGDSIYTGSSDNTSSANLDNNECVLVSPSPSTTSTFISSVRLTLGPLNSATDTVTVLGNVVGGAPTGTVSFYVCHTSVSATLTVAPCPATGTAQDAAVPLLTGAGASSAAGSTSFVPTSVGSWCFSAVYSGSSTYASSSDNTSATNLDSDECMLVAPGAGDSITSAPNASCTAGLTCSFLVTTSGSPTPVIKRVGKLPKGVKFTNNHNGTASLSGIPNVKKGLGVFHLTIEAKFGKGKAKKTVSQAFVLTVT
jgi:hypothetical protein